MTEQLTGDGGDSIDSVERELGRLRRVTGVVGALVASTDGRAVSCDLAEQSPGAAAAITASSLGLAARLGELTGAEARLQELQARTTQGYVCLYAIGDDWLLAVLTDLSVNLARLKLDVREIVGEIGLAAARARSG
jgi:predicted regulator of Ras-like GTPase activity (Roadblock/LC7/MglB family)